MGHLVDRTHRELSDDDTKRIADTYHAWQGQNNAGEYADMPGFCKSTTLDEIRKHGHVLTPGRYVGAEPQEDDGEPFEAEDDPPHHPMARTTSRSRQLGRCHRGKSGHPRVFGQVGNARDRSQTSQPASSMTGRLHPILDSLNRAYLYASNIAINDGVPQPVYFAFGEERH